MTQVNTTDRVITINNWEYKYSPEDFVNAGSGEFDARDSRMNRAWVIHNAGYVLAIVFAEYYAYSDQDAMDEAADSGKLDGMKCSEGDLEDMQVDNFDSENPEYHGVGYYGNASEPFADETLDYFCVKASAFKSDEVIRKMLYDASIVRTTVHAVYDVA